MSSVQLPNMSKENTLQKRIAVYERLSHQLASYNNDEMAQLLDTAQHVGSSIGGTSALLMIDDVSIFIKKIRLTDLERAEENVGSTRNLFELPLHYQYGIGSTGFGAWRELSAHNMTTEWVLANDCSCFPMLYHYRVLPSMAREITAGEMESLEKDVRYWENSPAIRARLLAKQQATAEIVLFLEYIPYNLQTWLRSQLIASDSAADAACLMVDNQLHSIVNFINQHELLHLDAHFENILTDGEQLYLSDFGLALSSRFDLSEAEIDFFNRHCHYDLYSVITNFLYSIVSSKFGGENWEVSLERYLNTDDNRLSPVVDAIVRKYASIIPPMDKFYCALQSQSKSTRYPKEELDRLYEKIITLDD